MIIKEQLNRDDMRVYALHCGDIKLDFSMIVRDKHGYITIPVPAWLIIHPKGKILFDSGFHRDVADPKGRWFARLKNKMSIKLKPENNIVEQVALCQTDVNDIDFLINSHLHTDHCGGNEYVKNATLVLQKREYLAAKDNDNAEKSGYFPQDYNHGHSKILVSGEYDLFGDGRITLVPTYGHTIGHQSLLLKMDNGKKLLLCADACSFEETLQRMVPPSKCYSDAEFIESLKRIKALHKRGIELYYGHDPAAWNYVSKAPEHLN
jgi:glyoxylase-like metal-dependent hydrolase (beta-lactamase superfamily II)